MGGHENSSRQHPSSSVGRGGAGWGGVRFHPYFYNSISCMHKIAHAHTHRVLRVGSVQTYMRIANAHARDSAQMCAAGTLVLYSYVGPPHDSTQGTLPSRQSSWPAASSGRRTARPEARTQRPLKSRARSISLALTYRHTCAGKCGDKLNTKLR